MSSLAITLRKKEQTAEPIDFWFSKLRIVSHIAAGNSFTCPLDGVRTPYPRSIGSLRSQHDMAVMKGDEQCPGYSKGAPRSETLLNNGCENFSYPLFVSTFLQSHNDHVAVSKW